MEIWFNDHSYLYLLKDYHRDYIDGRVSIQQQEDFIWAVKQKPKNEVFVIAEDAYSYFDKNTRFKDLYKKIYPNLDDMIKKIEPLNFRNSNTISTQLITPLWLLINTCQNCGIQSYNSECLFINYLRKRDICSMQDVIEDLEEKIKELNSDKSLKIKYEEMLKELEDLKKFAKSKDESNFEKTFKEIRSKLVDYRTFHKLRDCLLIKHVFVFEGIGHIGNLKPNLDILGYKHQKTIGISPLEKDVDETLKNALDLKQTFTTIFEEQTNLKA